MAKKIFGTWDLSLDNQNRIVIPPEVYNSLEGELDLRLACNLDLPLIDIRTATDYNILHEKFKKDKKIGPEEKQIIEDFYWAAVFNSEIDKNRRLTIKKELLDKAKVTKVATLVCSGDKMRLYPKEEYDKQKAAAEQNKLKDAFKKTHNRFYEYDEGDGS
jgi:division/cell wall cluster transcriptional repressor MraZ